jgi:alpha-ribazole phosphatase
VPSGLTAWLIRHPPPDIAPGVCYGRLDIGLKLGADNAVNSLRAELPPLAAVLASPLARCRALAEGLHAAPEFDERLLEINFGAWEGRTWEEIGREALDAWAADPLGHRPPGGESAREMAARVVSFAADFSCRIKAQGAFRDVAIIAHQGPLRVLMAHWQGEPESAWLSRQFDYARPVRCVVPL